MIEENHDIATRDGKMTTFVCRPERGAHPLAVLLMDAAGIREELYDMARRLASVGYAVVLPDLYYRAGRDTKYGPDVLIPGSDAHTRMRAARNELTIPAVLDDLAEMIAFADGQEHVKAGGIGVHGYCMSGPYALAAAARYPDRVVAAASFYGTWLVGDTEESPHRTLAQSKGELYIACPEFDDLAPLPVVAELRDHLEQSGAAGEIETYPGVHHGFAFPSRKVYDRAADERHWERLISLYRRQLG